ncbi:MAG: hypothetical protein ABI333_07900 [bacterium]
MKLLPDRRASTPEPLRRDAFWWLRDQDALVRRFVLAQALDAPRSQRPLPDLRLPRRGR